MTAFQFTLSTFKRHSEVTSWHVLHNVPDMTSNFNHASELYYRKVHINRPNSFSDESAVQNIKGASQNSLAVE
jgi:hypothetical protein